MHELQRPTPSRKNLNGWGEGLNGFGSSDKNFEVWHPTYNKPGRRGLLQAYFYEDYARQLDAMSEGERTERMIGDMDEVHPGLRQHLETVVTKSRQRDPWQKGAYTVHHPGQLEWFPAICRREGKVWFAGEHACGRHGCRARSHLELRQREKSTPNPA